MLVEQSNLQRRGSREEILKSLSPLVSLFPLIYVTNMIDRSIEHLVIGTIWQCQFGMSNLMKRYFPFPGKWEYSLYRSTIFLWTVPIVVQRRNRWIPLRTSNNLAIRRIAKRIRAIWKRRDDQSVSIGTDPRGDKTERAISSSRR